MAETIAELQAKISVEGLEKAKRDFDAVGDAGKKAGEKVGAAGTKMAKTGGKSNMLSRQMNQLSFGVQDFIVTIGDGGLGRALSASSNNFAQMAAMAGGVSGAMVGLGVTVLSMVPRFFSLGESSKEAAEKMKESMSKAKKGVSDDLEFMRRDIERTRKAMQLGFTIQDMRAKGDPKAPDAALKQADRDLAIAQAALPKARSGGKRLLDSTLKKGGVSEFRRPKNTDQLLNDIVTERRLKTDKDFREKFERDNKNVMAPGRHGIPTDAVTAAKERGEDARRRLRNSYAAGFEGAERTQRKGVMDEAIDSAVNNIIKHSESVEDAQKRINKFEDTLNDVNNAKRKRDAAMAANKGRVEAHKEMMKRIDETANFEQKEFERQQKIHDKRVDETATFNEQEFKWRDEELRKKQAEEKRLAAKQKREDEKKRREEIRETRNMKRGFEDILETIDPEAAERLKINQKFDKFDKPLIDSIQTFGPGGGVQELLDASRAARKKQLAAVSGRKFPGISGGFQSQDFAKQLQSALLKNDTQKMLVKHSERTSVHTKETVQAIKDLTRKVEKLEGSGFGP